AAMNTRGYPSQARLAALGLARIVAPIFKQHLQEGERVTVEWSVDNQKARVMVARKGRDRRLSDPEAAAIRRLYADHPEVRDRFRAINARVSYGPVAGGGSAVWIEIPRPRAPQPEAASPAAAAAALAP